MCGNPESKYDIETKLEEIEERINELRINSPKIHAAMRPLLADLTDWIGATNRWLIADRKRKLSEDERPVTVVIKGGQIIHG